MTSSCLQNAPKVSAPGPMVFAGLSLQRKCACGGSAALASECDDCTNKKLSLQRSPQESEDPRRRDSVPAIVNEVLRSPGQPLDSETRAFMEPRFGHDFGRVRIHVDANAHQAVKATNALAFTVGDQIAFSNGRFAPRTPAGQRLLAHELAHVVQQRNAVAGPAFGVAQPSAETEADQIASAVTRGVALPAVSEQLSVSLARYPPDEPVDTPEVRQVLCVSRLGGCASSRSGGLPTPAEIANYNVTCRSETSYSGPDVTPSDAQCRNPPQLPSSSLIFARSLATTYPGWLGVLPNCPCTDALARSSSDWSGPGACQPPYHVGAATGYRSTRGYASIPGTNHGQQCCYDSAGLLITEGAGAGTPDIVQAPSGTGAALWGTLPFTSTPGLAAAASHYLNDVVPFNDLGWEIYNRYWIPNNGNNCPTNRQPP